MKRNLKNTHEDGQSIILVVLAMGIFLIGAVGLGFDGSHLYSERVRAQLAADAAAQAAIMSIFDGTSTSTSNFTCTTADTKTACVYARDNGFGGTTADTVSISFPSSSAVSGVSLASGYPANLVQATVQRSVPTTLMRMLGPTATTVEAVGVAAIVSVTAPIPILVIHPDLTTSFSVQGQPTVQICGGPPKSIQVNSDKSVAVNVGGNAAVDLSHAGPLDTAGDCTTGTGADFGTWGGPAQSSMTVVNGSSGCRSGDVCIGTAGHYLDHASPVPDPLWGVSPPSAPATTGPASGLPVAAGSFGCPATVTGGCKLYTPGTYANGINVNGGGGIYALFAPGIYYMSSGKGFACSAGCTMAMATGLNDSSNTLTYTTTGGNVGSITSCCGTGTGWDGVSQSTGGMLVYNSGGGLFTIASSATANLIGSPSSSSYKGILFFEDHSASANNSVISGSPKPHKLGGGGNLTLYGTIYLTNGKSTISTSTGEKQFQELDLYGNTGNTTKVTGMIIVDSLQLGGGGTIVMNLNGNPSLVTNQVALVQ